eukprot:10934483-Alexandrium_andersonii.AAC.1
MFETFKCLKQASGFATRLNTERSKFEWPGRQAAWSAAFRSTTPPPRIPAEELAEAIEVLAAMPTISPGPAISPATSSDRAASERGESWNAGCRQATFDSDI